MAKPTNTGIWATGGAAITEPLLAEKQLGWEVGKKPPAQWFNWWMNIVHLWIVWLDAFESTVHTWTALQTFNAGVLAPAFGGTAGLRGTTAIASVPAVSGTTTAAANAIFGTSTHANGRGAYFTNTAASGGGVALETMGRYGGVFIGTEFAGVIGQFSSGATSAQGAGVLGVSVVSERPGIRGEGNESSGAWGGEFLGADSGESSEEGGLGIYFKGGNSSITDAAINAGDGMVGQAGDATGDGSLGQSGSGGTNTLRGGNVDGLLNDEGLPGVGLTLTGGSVTDDSNGRVGATALRVIAGTAANGAGLAIDAEGDQEIDGNIRLLGSNAASNTPQTQQISPGLMCKAWARVKFTGGVVSLTSGQNISGVGIQDAAQGRIYVDFAIEIDKLTRCAVGLGDVGRSCSSLEETVGDALGRTNTRAIFRIASLGTGPDTPINLAGGAGAIYVVVFGL